MYLIGYDIGSSSIKAALVEIRTGKAKAVVQQPAVEMVIDAPQLGWAEQHPDTWWRYVCQATRQLLNENDIIPSEIKGVGISYQMHGLVMLNKAGKVIRPSIIWCDSRAVEIGQDAFEGIGEETCLREMLNSPGNFTASKLAWVKRHEPELYAECEKIMLPGDYIAYKLSGEIQTTITGLSEGVLWDFVSNTPAKSVLNYFGIDDRFLPSIVDSVSLQCTVSELGAEQTGLAKGTPISYRAGDQPNNAMSLNVLQPGEIAATGGTSGVVYGVVDKAVYDARSRVNGFAHVNHSVTEPRIGILLCVNGAGIQYGWLRKMIGPGSSYNELELKASRATVGADKLSVISFGNGAERMLENREIGAHFCNLQLNRHQDSHMIRATLEGIAFAFIYGMEILKSMGIEIRSIRVGNDNLFQSKIFSSTVATLAGAEIKMIDTTGAIGAALAAGVGIGIYENFEMAMSNLSIVDEVFPDPDASPYQVAYDQWKGYLDKFLPG
ncbi:MAG: carbohydrate kinase [Saprospiraceae bacterium]|nr:carbohydrate kinase [Saprospiraceae bacterium]